jgi:phosphoribosylglycinamide formyltransferase 2
VRIFGKPTTRPYRRMAVCLAYDKKGADVTKVKKLAMTNAKKIRVITE